MSIHIQMDSTHLSEIHERVVKSKQVQDAIASENGSVSAARRMVERIVGVQRSFLSWLVALIIRFVFPFIFPMGMHIDRDSLQLLKAAVAETGRISGSTSSKKRPIILLPTHKSHVDYLALALLFAEFKLPMPLVVAGDNLNMPVLGAILHGGGAMFIRRSFAGDRVYSAVFNETMIELLEGNHIMGCFIEGGRSRSGKLLTPKAGFLKSVVDAVLDGRVDDALLVPIAFSYGRVVEAKSMAAEMSGGTKKKEALGSSLRSMVHLFRTAFWGAACYGSIEISVAPAFSVREHLKSREAAPAPAPEVLKTDEQVSGEAKESPHASPVSTTETPNDVAGFDLDAVQQPGTAVYQLKSFNRKLSIVLDPSTLHDKKTRVQLALSLGFRSLHECNRIGVIQGTTLVGTILLMHKDRRGLKISDLVEKVDWLTREIVSRGGHVQTSRSVEETVAEVVDKIMWGSGRARLVKKHKSVVMTGLFTPMETLELSTFRNSLIHFFVQDAIVAIGLHAVLARSSHHGGADSPTPASPESVSGSRHHFAQKLAPLSDVAQSSQFLSVLLKHEFIYKPITGGVAASPTTGPQGDLSSDHKCGDGVSAAFVDNFKSITAFMTQRNVIEISRTGEVGDMVQIGGKGKAMFEFLCGLLFPFIDSYYLTLLGSFVFLTDSGMDMSTLVSKIQELGENLYMNNLMDHYDAVAKDTVVNAITAFTDIGILAVDQTPDRQKLVKFKIPKSQVLQSIELLHSFRKGKGRMGDAPHQIADAIDLGESLAE